jgi:hypothetical protein
MKAVVVTDEAAGTALDFGAQEFVDLDRADQGKDDHPRSPVRTRGRRAVPRSLGSPSR